MTLNGSVDLGAATRTINVNSFLNTSTLGGVISGATGAGLTKTGPGTFVLSVANTFDGPVTINGGDLSATVAGALGIGTTAGNIDLRRRHPATRRHERARLLQPLQHRPTTSRSTSTPAAMP